ncbi:MAG: OmpA family protein [Pseudomonadota bacterium]|nr:OmpA family protein [Pseudomonadota bacterium]
MTCLPSTADWRNTALLALALGFSGGLGLGLAGCGSTPSAAASTPVRKPVPAARAGPDNDAIAIEQRWLLSYFKGTPVEIVRADDGALTVTVPAEFCFNPGSAVIKPPLAKVLEKVAQSLRRRSLLLVSAVEAPPDAKATSGLAVKRAQAVQRWLRKNGVDRRRLGSAGETADEVRLRLQWGASPG